MDSHMKTSILIAFRQNNMSPKQIAEKLGFKVEQVERVIYPNGKAQRSVKIVAVRRTKKLIPIDTSVKQVTENPKIEEPSPLRLISEALDKISLALKILSNESSSKTNHTLQAVDCR